MDFIAAKITEVAQLASGYTLLRFASKKPIKGKPGQFVMVRGDWGMDPILPRAFSLVEVGKNGAVLIRIVGKGTGLLARMRIGDAISVLGPLGHGFSDADDTQQPVLVAGGVGVAPLIFLSEQLATTGRPSTFIYGARTSEDLLLCSRIETTADLTVTTEDGSVGEKGLVTGPLERILSKGDPCRIFACGPEPMLKAVAKSAEKAGVPCQIALESPMACGIGICKGCAVPDQNGEFKYVCSDGPVFDAKSLYGGAK